jgi:hypothetical protein
VEKCAFAKSVVLAKTKYECLPAKSRGTPEMSSR